MSTLLGKDPKLILASSVRGHIVDTEMSVELIIGDPMRRSLDLQTVKTYYVSTC